MLTYTILIGIILLNSSTNHNYLIINTIDYQHIQMVLRSTINKTWVIISNFLKSIFFNSKVEKICFLKMYVLMYLNTLSSSQARLKEINK